MSKVYLETVDSAGKIVTREFKNMKNAKAAQKRYGGTILDNEGEVSTSNVKWSYNQQFNGCVHPASTESGTYLPVETHEEGVYESFDDNMDAQVDRVVAAKATKKNSATKGKKRSGVEPKGGVRPIRVGTDQELMISLLFKGSTKEEIVEALADRKNPMGVVTQVCRLKGYGYKVEDGVYSLVLPEGLSAPLFLVD